MKYFLLTLALFAPLPAFAHAQLIKAEPAVGSVVTKAPMQVSLHFSEGVEPGFTTVVVTSASGARVDDGAPRTAPDDNRTLQIGLKPLAPGDYRVEWHATSVDTHKTQGAFGFTVRQ